MTNLFTLQPMQSSHWPQVAQIYQLGLDTGLASFETQCPDWEGWHESHLRHSRWVAVQDKTVGGWAALSQVSKRAVYQGVAEVSIYIHPDYRGFGLGQKLMRQLISSSEQEGIWTLQASIFPENIASLRLHEKTGFSLLGKRHKIARHRGRWRDTLILERRSELPQFR
ncbi:MAG: N-acetyltransferase family protein [Bacteroidota bacterium]